MLGAQLGGIERARGIDGGDLRERRGVDGGNVRGGDPAVTDDTDVVFFHVREIRFAARTCHNERDALSKQKAA